MADRQTQRRTFEVRIVRRNRHSTKRRLTIENLSARELLAADLAAPPAEDTSVIQSVAEDVLSYGTSTQHAAAEFSVRADVNQDTLVTSLDALQIANAIYRGDTVTSFPDADIDGNGAIDDVDVSIVFGVLEPQGEGSQLPDVDQELTSVKPEGELVDGSGYSDAMTYDDGNSSDGGSSSGDGSSSGGGSEYCAATVAEGGPLPATAGPVQPGPSTFYTDVSGANITGLPTWTNIDGMVLGTDPAGPLVTDGWGDDSHVGALLVDSARTYYRYDPVEGTNLRNNTVTEKTRYWQQSHTNSNSLMSGSTLSSEINSNLQTSIGSENVGRITSEVGSKIGTSVAIQDTWSSSTTTGSNLESIVGACTVETFFAQYRIDEYIIGFTYYEDVWYGDLNGFTLHTGSVTIVSETFIGFDLESVTVPIIN